MTPCRMSAVFCSTLQDHHSWELTPNSRNTVTLAVTVSTFHPCDKLSQASQLQARKCPFLTIFSEISVNAFHVVLRGLWRHRAPWGGAQMESSCVLHSGKKKARERGWPHFLRVSQFPVPRQAGDEAASTPAFGEHPKLFNFLGTLAANDNCSQQSVRK